MSIEKTTVSDILLNLTQCTSHLRTQRFKGKVREARCTPNIQILRITDNISSLVCVYLGSTEKISVGDKIMVIGRMTTRYFVIDEFV